LPLALAPVFPLLSVVADLPATLLASAIPLAVPYPATGTKALDQLQRSSLVNHSCLDY